jgi:hypothetical protein
MESPFVHTASALPARRGARAVVIGALGPLTIVAGVVWAVAQPYRVTLLHPRGNGLWWLLVEPPLLVAAAGVVFWLVVARPLLADLGEDDEAAR